MPQNLDSNLNKASSPPQQVDSAVVKQDSATFKPVPKSHDSLRLDSPKSASISKKPVLEPKVSAAKVELVSQTSAQDSLFKDSIDRALKDIRFKLHTAYNAQEKPLIYFEGVPKDNSSLNWSLLILLFCLLILAVTKARFSKRLNLLFKSLKSWKFGKQVIRYERVYSHPTNVILLLIFLFSFSLFVEKVLFSEDFANLAEVPFFFLLVMVTAIYFLLKFILFFSVGKIFAISEITNEYFFHILLFLKFSGILLLPAALIYLYSSTGKQVGLWLGISILIIAYIARIVRGLLIGLQAKEKLYVIFLYLCSLEILPALVIGKFIKDMLIR